MEKIYVNSFGKMYLIHCYEHSHAVLKAEIINSGHFCFISVIVISML